MSSLGCKVKLPIWYVNVLISAYHLLKGALKHEGDLLNAIMCAIVSQKTYTFVKGSFNLHKKFDRLLTPHMARNNPWHSRLGTVFESFSSPFSFDIAPNLDNEETMFIV